MSKKNNVLNGLSKTLLIKIPNFYILWDIRTDDLTQLMEATCKTKLPITRFNWSCHLKPTSHFLRHIAEALNTLLWQNKHYAQTPQVSGHLNSAVFRLWYSGLSPVLSWKLTPKILEEHTASTISMESLQQDPNPNPEDHSLQVSITVLLAHKDDWISHLLAYRWDFFAS
jgi:hypothetical protein